MIEIHAYWISWFFNLANKIFPKKDIVQEQLHEIMEYETISSNVALLQLPNKNFYLVSRGVNFLHRKWSQPFVACPHMMI